MPRGLVAGVLGAVRILQRACYVSAARIFSSLSGLHMEAATDIRSTLLHGPYQAPRTRRGKFLACELRGKVKVGDYSDGPIPWPMKWGTRSIILCGDLIDAVKGESVSAIARNWGVSRKVVAKWRRALGVEIYNQGTTWLQHMTARENTTPQKMRELTMAARQVTRVPKPRRFKRYMAMRIRVQIERTGRPINPDHKLWTPAEDVLLGTKSDAALAKILGRTAGAIRSRRTALGIALSDPKNRPWTREEDRILGSVPDRTAARLLGRSERAVQLRRQVVGKPGLQAAARRWTPEEDALLGKLDDREVARRVGRTLSNVQIRRHLKGIPNPSPLRRPWTEGELALLGTMPDEELARKLGRSVSAILHQRAARGVPNPAPRRKYWLPREIKLLGTASDAKVAHMLGCDVESVKAKRARLGIPAPEEY